MNDTDMEQWMLDVMIALQPGNLEGNAKILLNVVKAYAAEGEPVLELPRDMLCGGDCGSLADHPVFKAAVAKAQEKFLKAAAKVKNAPKIVFTKPYRPTPVAAGPNPRRPFCGRAEEVFPRQVVGLARRLSAIHCSQVVIGLSGGLDSALALLVAHAAFQLLDLDKTGIHVYTMPGFGTTKRTRGNADLLCEGLGLKLETIDITPACRQHFKDIKQPASRHDVVFENTQARERTQILMDKANQFGGIVLGTGDMSEIALGWCTYNGDHMSMFGVNAGVPKTAVRDVCMWWAEEVEAGRKVGSPEELKAAQALRDIVATPVSPELLPAKGGEIAQKTEDKIGPYDLHDFFLWHFIAEKEGKPEILKAAKAAFRGEYDAATIRKWLDVFFRRLFMQSFKRNCAPDGIPVYSVYLAPNAWHMPSDISLSAFA
ncbi:MAG: NAD(+) synthase [bacterium]|nr:NAD(+) synthase [bacterium]